ncbi:RNA polymerase sigma factor SigM [Glycomyces buryatensis]|uniref:RNA polymerase sigma factor SigM n=1 Tax=Glycomyces buryatensis TaxID=2570927 RepID=A0A4S8Q8A5_9ACTN|nr:RNA polymerase sigma factor SigM [Glycomyces buryatensis]THV40617.1 RNA polymerase sigma factor SigM [Glycomyces buryatensis]
MPAPRQPERGPARPSDRHHPNRSERGPSSEGNAREGDFGTDEVADADLLARHVAGDRDAFGELFRRHRGRLWAVAVRTLANPEDAAEALQDAMIKAYQAAGSFRGTSAVTTWLHRIVVNACLDRLRSAARRPTVPLADDLLPASGGTGPETGPENVTLRLSVHRALAQLPFEQRAVLVYIDMLGYPVDEVAAILKVRPGTVKSRASRARKRIAADLPEFDPAGPAEARPEPGGGNPQPRHGVEPGATRQAGPAWKEEGRR